MSKKFKPQAIIATISTWLIASAIIWGLDSLLMAKTELDFPIVITTIGSIALIDVIGRWYH